MIYYGKELYLRTYGFLRFRFGKIDIRKRKSHGLKQMRRKFGAILLKMNCFSVPIPNCPNGLFCRPFSNLIWKSTTNLQEWLENGLGWQIVESYMKDAPCFPINCCKNNPAISFKILNTNQKMTKITSEITLTVTMDENRIPEKLHWNAPMSVERMESKLLSVLGQQSQKALRIDLWTKDMPLDEMKLGFIKHLLPGNTYQRAN